MNRHRSQNPSHRRQKGLTLLELSLSITVGLILIGIGVGIYSSTRGSADSFKAATQLQQLAGAMRDVYARSSSYAGLTSASFVTSGRVPTDMVSGTNIVNVYGIPVILGPETGTTYGAANARFSIAYGGVPREQCVSLVLASAESFDGVEVGTSTTAGVFTIVGAPVKNASTGVLPTVATATAACDRPVSGLRFIGR